VVAVVVIASSGGGSGLKDYQTAEPLNASKPVATIHVKSAPAASQATNSSSGSAGAGLAGASSTGVPTTAYRAPSSTQSIAAVPTPVPTPNAGTGAKQIQSAQISLSVNNDHINQVATEVFAVVSDEHGYVGSSRVTAATRNSGGGYAFFTLSIPTSNLQEAMTQLSRLRYAAVSSRTDASQDVGGQYSRDQRQLRDAQALRVSLLKQLQIADSQTAIDSIEAQLKTAEAQITRAQATLHSLQHQIGYSSVSVQINSGGLPVIPVTARSHGFTISRGGHDAVRVLIVAAGVALIVLAVMIPIGLVVALLGWVGVVMRQRRRERALDAG
jgi:hypothetical protein